MARKQETPLVQSCLGWVKNNGGDGFHVHGSATQRSGEPDIDASIPVFYPTTGAVAGFLHFKVEAKILPNTPSILQLERLAKYASLGYVTGVVYSLEDFEQLATNAIEKLLKQTRGLNPVR